MKWEGLVSGPQTEEKVLLREISTSGPVLSGWIGIKVIELETVIQREVSQKEKNKYRILIVLLLNHIN